jgi:hypothetical protein
MMKYDGIDVFVGSFNDDRRFSFVRIPFLPMTLPNVTFLLVPIKIVLARMD